MEEKIFQLAARKVLECNYDQDFLGFSYGFRRGRSQHRALDAQYVGITKRKVNWITDADRVNDWRQRQAKGEVIVVPYADDLVIGFREEYDAWGCLAALRERFARFGMSLHPRDRIGSRRG